jgi:integrase/recombinase XerC
MTMGLSNHTASLTSSAGRGKTQPLEISTEWADILRSWQLWARSRDLSSGTIEVYENKLKSFLRWLRDDFGWQGDLEALAVEHLREFLVHIQQRGLSGQTRLSYRNALRSLWKYMREDDLVADDFFLSGRIPRPKVIDKVVSVLEADELTGLYKVATKDPYLGPRDLALLAVLEDSGLRVSELCGLDLADVNWDTWLLFVKNGKGGRQRMAPLGATAMRYLDRYVKSWRRKRMSMRKPWAEQHDRLFIGRSGLPLQTESVRNRLKTLATLAGIDPGRVHPHVFRHGAATRLADAGMTETELRALFGWTRDSGMTERYTRSTTASRAIASHRRMSPLDHRQRSG